MPRQHNISRKPIFPAEVYNDGIVIFYKRSPKKDKYGTLIPGAELLTEVRKEWYRKLGTTSEEVFQSGSLGTEVKKRIAIPLKEIDSKWICEISGKKYEIYRPYENPRKNETELSLMEEVKS